jgi:hypothetical protein
MYSCCRGKYFVAKTTPTPDVVNDDDNYCAALLHILLLKAG